MTDHATLADGHAEESILANRNGNWETSRLEMSLARFHADRALIQEQKKATEQQRIANLIAVLSAENSDFFMLTPERAGQPDMYGNVAGAMLAELQAALGGFE